MNYHVFVVDDTTFRTHLEYMFVGIGAGNKKVPFLTNFEDTELHHSTERNLVNMIADISRLCIGDKIIFYLQANKHHQGLFFGIFKVASTPFFDENDNDNFLKTELHKSLTFRCLIEPDNVYSVGVTEHDYLDSLNGITHPSQMCWSLIYRKLKGNRGCTMITEFEFNMLVNKLRGVNRGICLENISGFSFDNVNAQINIVERQNQYNGRRDSINIQNRLLFKANCAQAFEVHLQTYILQNLSSENLCELLLQCPRIPYWVGNEVSCGVGMQRIDIMIKQEDDDNIYIKVIELKCVVPELYILSHQLKWYLDWVSDYIVPTYQGNNKTIHIIPCVIAKHTDDDNFFNNARQQQYLLSVNNVIVDPVQYISFTINDRGINFVREL